MVYSRRHSVFNILFFAFLIAPSSFLLGACSDSPNDPSGSITVPDDKGTDDDSSTKVFDTVISRINSLIYQEISNQSQLDRHISSWLSDQQTNGSWSSINYTSTKNTLWEPSDHIKRLRRMAIAYTRSTSQYYKKASCYSAIERGLQYWYDADPRSKNWFMQQISSPQCIGEILCLMHFGKEQLPKSIKDKLFARMVAIGGRPDIPKEHGTGANRIDIATHWMYRGALTNNETLFKFGVKQMMGPICLAVTDGIQHDYSYHQHGKQLYIGGYGAVLLDRIPKLLYYLKGTDYTPEKSQVAIFTKFVCHSYSRVIRGNHYMYNVCGRSMARKGTFDRKSDLSKFRLLISADPENASLYRDCIARIDKSQTADYKMPKLLTHYWRSDYTLFTSPLWNFDVRMLSTRTDRAENGNGENLRGYFLSDGATCISRTGNEYASIMPFWDWSMIPGTTSPHLSKFDIPVPKPWGSAGFNLFSGGVSTDLYGVSAYAYNDILPKVMTRAKKSYFFLDKEVFCMGSGIKSLSGQTVRTTVNQCLSEGTSFRDKENHWVIQDKIAYYFPIDENWDTTTAVQEGDWHDIVSSYSSQINSGEVFKVWLEHGIQPVDASYQYAVIAGINSPDAMQTYLSSRHVEVIRCDKQVHAICPNVSNIKLMAVVYEATDIKTSEMTVSVNHPCFLMITDTEIVVSVPNDIYSTIKLKITSSDLAKEYTLTFDNSLTHLGKSLHVTR